jgi:O-antigen/teichoic acid export membrane protein
MLLASLVALPVAVGGFMTAEPLIRLIFGAEYAPAAAALAWLLVGVPIATVREVAVAALIASPGGERRLIRVNATCAVFNVAILIPVVPAYGLIGAAVVTVLTEVLRLFMAVAFARLEGFNPPATRRFLKPTVGSAAMVPAILAAGDRPLPVLVGIGMVVYAGMLLLLGVLRMGRPFQVRVVV